MISDSRPAASMLRYGGVCLWLLLVLQPRSASALEAGFRLDAGAGVPASEPQKTYYSTGLSLRMNGFLEVLPSLDGQASLGYGLWPDRPDSPMAGPASLITAELGLRLKRPRLGAQFVPFIDASGFYVRTGSRDKLGLGGSLGFLFRTSTTSTTLFGPAVRYQHIFKLGGERGFESFNAALFSVGLALEFAVGEARAAQPVIVQPVIAPPPPPPPPPLLPEAQPAVIVAQTPVVIDSDNDGLSDSVDRCPMDAGPAAFGGCPDRDGDGVSDADDKCPKVPGPLAMGGCPDLDPDRDGVVGDADACPLVPGAAESNGCPVYKQIVVTESKIELKQKIFFAFGLTTILPKSYDLLGEVVQALNDRPQLCVRIEGHTDSKGKKELNLRLSAGRAAAVMQFLADEGIARERLSSQGYGSSLPLDDNTTAAGRENNRRVEFVVVGCEGKAQ